MQGTGGEDEGEAAASASVHREDREHGCGEDVMPQIQVFFFFFFLPISVCISGESHEQQEVMSLQRKEKTRRCKGWGKT